MADEVDNGCPDDCIARDQVEAALQYLEWCHGEALRRPDSAEARGRARLAYDAIDIVEAALDNELQPPAEQSWLEWDREIIEKSRQARAEGHGRARLSKDYSSNEEEDGFVAAVRNLFD